MVQRLTILDKKLITPDMTIDVLLDKYPQLAEVMVAHTMLCVGCFISHLHTVADVAAIYGLDVDTFIRELQQHLTDAQDC